MVHPLRCKAIASARLKNDKGRRRDPGAAAARGPAARGVDSPAAGAPAPGGAAAPGRPGAAPAWPSRVLPPASREIVTDCLAVIDGLAPVIDRIDGELHQHARAVSGGRSSRTRKGSVAV